MTQDGKGKAFFDRADQVGATGNWDFAIEMYLEGLTREPGNMERGHKPLRDVSLSRASKGGKAAGMMEGLKRRPGKDPAANLINAEFLLAKEPGNVQHMLAVLKAAKELQLIDVAKWMADIVLESQRLAPKPSRQILTMLTDHYENMELYGSAIQAMEVARKAWPDDGSLGDRLGKLSAKYTIQLGQYDKEGSFLKGVKNFDEQKKLIQQDNLVQDKAFLLAQVEKARKEYEETPKVQGKIYALVDALLKTADEGDENVALDVLAKAYRDTGAYQHKMRQGDIRIRQMTRRFNKLIGAGDKQAAAEQARKQLEFELEEYTERAQNYPTDLTIKFELGRRQFLSGNYDGAIASLQQAQRDPKRHVMALIYLGRAFSHKSWNREAAETFERALQSEMSEERKKEVLYNLGDVYEKIDELPKAQDMFSSLAQLDFNFRDTRQRLEAIRKKMNKV